MTNQSPESTEASMILMTCARTIDHWTLAVLERSNGEIPLFEK
jgi:hypothetical protein